jgi:DNA-binding winged helix-turn-helix (wHTH) protein/Tol biopolymer transport system component
LDLEVGFLRRGGEEVKLAPKPFELLAYLVERHGRLVTKTELTEALWPDTAITDNSMAQVLVEVRRALADDSQQLIRTVARRGYLFSAPVTTPVVEFPRQQVVAPGDPSAAPAPPGHVSRKRLNRPMLVCAIALLPIWVAGLLLVRQTRPARQDFTYTQITNFTDSAVSPVLSPDGRMVAFFRSDEWFLTTDQIYIKLLPNGEPVQLTNDRRLKCCVAFSPDGSRIAYTVQEPGPSRGWWKTYIVSPLGGEPTLLLSNAAGLTWLDQRRLLFSEIRTGINMGIVTATENRAEYRQIYFPQHERAMVHFSYASPDRKWVLAPEMDPVWRPCRVIPLDGSSTGRQVGPQGSCYSAAWSPDGKWMYFGAEVEGNYHLWRQRFPNGALEQITSGPAEERGIAMAPDGRSLITSVGMPEGTAWIHDGRGERPLHSEGYVAPMRLLPFPSTRFSSDGKSVYYLLRRDLQTAASELWRTELASGKSRAVLSGISMTEYNVSPDDKEVLFSTQPYGKESQIWLAPLDRSSPPKLIESTGGWPHFGPDGEVLFQMTDGKANYLARMKKDGSGRSKVAPYPIGNIHGTSPDRRWILVGIPQRLIAVPIGGGAPRQICSACPVSWSPDGKFFYVGVERNSLTSRGKTVAIPVQPGESFPDLSVSGIRGLDDAAAFSGARVIDGYEISPGPDPSVFAYVKTAVHKNLFRIPLRDD